MIRVLLLIRSLDNGGMERQFTELVKAMDKTRFSVTAVTFYDTKSPRSEEIAALSQVRLLSLHKKGRWDLTGFFLRALRLVRQESPQVIYGFAQEPNSAALLLGRLAGARVVWGVRSSVYVLPSYDWFRLASFWIGAFLSRFADRIIYNSEYGRQSFSRHRYSSRNAAMVPNGFDTNRFLPNEEVRSKQRQAWGARPDQFIIGIAGRLDPLKDHPNFLRAASLIAADRPDLRFACIGGGPADYAKSLRDLASELGLGEKVIWTDECDDMTAAYNAIDLLALCSTEEGCPNVVGEAMACGTPCVVTDVGDTALLLGDAGLVISPGDPVVMADAWRKMVEMTPEDRKRIGESARSRIEKEFSLPIMASRTEAILSEAWTDGSKSKRARST